MSRLIKPKRELVLPRRSFLKGAAASLAAPALIGRAAQAQAPPDYSLWLNPYGPQSIWQMYPISPVLNTEFAFDIGAGQLPGIQDSPSEGSPIFYGASFNQPLSVATYAADILSVSGSTVTIPHWPNSIWGWSALFDGDAFLSVWDSTQQVIHECYTVSGSPGNAYEMNGWAIHETQGWGVPSPDKPIHSGRGSSIGLAAGALRLWELQQVLATNGTFFPQHALSITPAHDIGMLANAYNDTQFVSPMPVFPATFQDYGFYAYQGTNPNICAVMGQQFFLPSNFDFSNLTTVAGVAIAKTLQKFGAYVVDTSTQAIFILAEAPYSYLRNPTVPEYWFQLNGNCAVNTGWSLAMGACAVGGNNPTAGSLDIYYIMEALQPMVSNSGWLDGNGNGITRPNYPTMNLLSLRYAPGVEGPAYLIPWASVSGTAVGGFDPQLNRGNGAYTVPAGSASFQANNYLLTGFAPDPSAGPWNTYRIQPAWFLPPVGGSSYTLKVGGFGNISLQLIVGNNAEPPFSTTYFTSNVLRPGQSQTFTWPNEANFGTELILTYTGSAAAQLSATLML